MQRIGFIAKVGNKRAEGAAVDLGGWLEGQGVTVVADGAVAAGLGIEATVTSRIPAEVELVIVVGGDGTLIHVAQLVGDRGVPILGVNAGALGFLTEVPLEEAREVLGEVLRGNFTVQERIRLEVRLHRGGEELLRREVLNDVVINKGALARIADFETTIDGHHLTTFRGDGLIVGTPTGSTAYSMAAGGPILHPTLRLMIITPICPHTLTYRSIVVPESSRLGVTLISDNGRVYLTLDGQAGEELELGDRLEIQVAESVTCLVTPPRRDYFGVLREKLHWGAR